MSIHEYLNNYRLILDGSMGTYFQALVNKADALCEMGNINMPETIGRIHREYIKAGAKLIRTNTFAANKAVLKTDTEGQVRIIEAACRIAKEAKNEKLSEFSPLWIAGNIGPIPEDASTEEADILNEYKLQCDIFIREELDAIHFETFSSLKYILQLIPYIKEKKRDIFILVSFSLDKNGYTEAGISVSRLVEQVTEIDGLDAFGFNCGIGSGHLLKLLKRITLPENKYIYAAPNAGYPEAMQNRMVFMDNAEYFAENIKLIADIGIDMLGGCCGTTPEYIKGIVANVSVENPVINRRDIRKKIKSQALSIKKNPVEQLLNSGNKVIAVELDPPYDSAVDKVMECAHQLKSLGADIITIADSPMGRSRVDSILMSIKIAEDTGMNVVPHICCRDRNMISMRSTILGAYIHGIRNLLIVTGDPVPQANRTSTTGVFDYNSYQLMEYVKEMNKEHFIDDPIIYGGALNHRRGKVENIAKRMQGKIEQGAKFFLTQPIYSREDAERIRILKEMVDTKILCGIMPLVSYRNANFIKNEIAGIYVPDEIINRYDPDMTREEAENVGVSIAKEMIELLDPIADGYYFMLPFNRVSLIEKIFKN